MLQPETITKVDTSKTFRCLNTEESTKLYDEMTNLFLQMCVLIRTNNEKAGILKTYIEKLQDQRILFNSIKQISIFENGTSVIDCIEVYENFNEWLKSDGKSTKTINDCCSFFIKGTTENNPEERIYLKQYCLQANKSSIDCIESVKKKISLLKTTIEKCQHSIESINNAVSCVEKLFKYKDYAKLEIELFLEANRRAEKFNSQIDSQKEYFSKLDEILLFMKAEKKGLFDEACELKNEISNLNTEQINTFNQEMSQLELTSTQYQKQIQEFDNEKLQLELDLRIEKRECERIKPELDEKINEVTFLLESMKSCSNEFGNQIRNLTVDNDSKIKAFKNLAKKYNANLETENNETLEICIDDLVKYLEHSKECVCESQKKVEQLGTELEKAKKDLSIIISDFVKIKHFLSDVQSELEKTKESVELKKMKADLEQTKSELEITRQKLNMFQQLYNSNHDFMKQTLKDFNNMFSQMNFDHPKPHSIEDIPEVNYKSKYSHEYIQNLIKKAMYSDNTNDIE